MRAETAQLWTVPQLADHLGIAQDKVLAWLRGGELVGINVAERPGRRPRWRIADAEFQRFLRARQSAAAPKIHRTRGDNGEREFFRHGRPVAVARA